MKFDPSVNPNAVALAAAVLSVISKGAAAARGDVNEDAYSSMLPGGRVAAVLAGRELGRLNMPNEAVDVEIVNWNLLTTYLRAKRPGVLESKEVVRIDPLFLQWLIKDLRGRAAAVDKDGEVVPGVIVTVGTAPTVNLVEDADAVIAEALADPAARPLVVAALEAALAGVLGMPGLTLNLPDPAAGEGS
ncbi:MAG: hypothetical protein JWL97_3764 [Gemmatimonadales bacterium]|nr:hypothetical protein [Gemmatimonadales bacterium]